VYHIVALCQVTIVNSIGLRPQRQDAIHKNECHFIRQHTFVIMKCSWFTSYIFEIPCSLICSCNIKLAQLRNTLIKQAWNEQHYI